MPAALTSESRPPSVSTAQRTPSITESSSPTSIGRVARRSAVAASPARAPVVARPSAAMSEATTVAPSSSNRSAVAWPIPDAAPVTRIRLPSSRFIWCMVDAMDIGFIGLGNMGRGMAANLVRAGHRVTVYNRSPGKEEALVQQGATAAGSVAEASNAEVVFTMLADDRAVEGCRVRRERHFGLTGTGRHPRLVE